MKNSILLKEIAEIRFGINGKGMKGMQIPFIQVKDYSDGKSICESDVFSVSLETIKDRDILKPGDILFAGKGSKSFSVVWNNDLINAVASSTFYVIQVIDKMVLPEYLSYFLNSEIAQSYFINNMYGVSIKNISKKVLEGLIVVVPEIIEQQKIVKMNELWDREQYLMKQLIQKKDKLYNKLFTQKIN